MVLLSLKASAAAFSTFSQILTSKHLPHSIWLCLHSFLTLSPRPSPGRLSPQRTHLAAFSACCLTPATPYNSVSPWPASASVLTEGCHHLDQSPH